MRLNHIHFAVRDLPVAIGWLEQVWDARPTFTNERMAEIPFGSLTLILDSADQESHRDSRFRERELPSRNVIGGSSFLPCASLPSPLLHTTELSLLATLSPHEWGKMGHTHSPSGGERGCTDGCTSNGVEIAN